MGLSLKPRHLKRYRDIARLLIKYGRSDLVKAAGIEQLDLADRSVAADAKSASAAAKPGRVGTALERRAASAAGNGVPDQGVELAADLEALGPTFVKVGQFLSTRSDLLPVAYLDALARLQDQLEPFPFAEVEKIVSEELGVRISKAFTFFEETPIAAASLGQVHRAELRSGRLVAVKVQRPAIREQVLEDLETLGELAGWLDHHTEQGKRYRFEAMLEEFRRSLVRELDYRQEARNLAILAENLKQFDLIVVPYPVEDYVTSRVLTMEFIHGRKVTSFGPLARMEIDGAPLAEELCRAYLKQTLLDGFFHADPHPGNVFVTDDGRIALLDLGMVAQLSPGIQESLLKLLLAVSEGRGEDAAGLAIKIGDPLPTFDETTVRHRIAEMVANARGLQLKDIQVGRMMYDIARVSTDGGIQMPRELTMLGKALLNIDQVGRHLDPSFDPNASIRRHAFGIMQRRMIQDLSPGKLFAGVLEMKELAEKLPGRLNDLMDAVANNRLRLNVDAIDEVLLIEGLQKIANRITLGLVISALIIGAAMMMRIETAFRLFGYPGLAILFFFAAGVSGLVMVFNILRHDLKSGKDKPPPRSGAPRGSTGGP